MAKSSTITDESTLDQKMERKKEKKLKKKEKREKKQQMEVAQITTEKNSEKIAKKKRSSEAEINTEEIVEPQTKKMKKDKKKKFDRPNDATDGKANNTKNSLTREEIEAFRVAREMTVSDPTDPSDDEGMKFQPARTFEESGFPDDMLASCKNFDKPTPIQSQCWPIAMKGRDLVGIAETGSGKTLAFALPALVHVKEKIKSNGKKKGSQPLVLILSPTRELAMQIAEVCTACGNSCGLQSVCIYGGVPKHHQVSELSRGVHVVIATPGRLLDLVNDGSCSLEHVSFLVLDEADRMLDMGFERDIRAIVGMLNQQRQTLMFSATWPTTIQKLAHEYLANPVKVTIGSPDLSANHNVKQVVEVVEEFHKEKKLKDLLHKYHDGKNRVLVFALYKQEASRLENMLIKNGWTVGSIHGDKGQRDRTAALASFKEGKVPLLIATDVAARGLDIPNVEYVINVTFPLTVEDYVHRIGRTGRAGKKGLAHTLFTPQDKAKAAELASVLRDANQPVPPELQKLCSAGTKKKQHELYGNHFKDTGFNPNAKVTHLKFDDD